MFAHVFFNLLSELRTNDKMRGLLTTLSLFRNESIKIIQELGHHKIKLLQKHVSVRASVCACAFELRFLSLCIHRFYERHFICIYRFFTARRVPDYQRCHVIKMFVANRII